MIEFNNLIEATKYVSTCPLCKKFIHIKDMDINYTLKFSGCSGKDYGRTLITFNQSSLSYNDKIIICLQTGEVTRDSKINTRDLSAQIGSHFASINGTPQTTGDMYFGLGMECYGCRDYYYMIQLVVNLEPIRLSKIYLNSESVIIRNDEGRYEIRNCYTTGNTEYLFSSGQPSEEGTIAISKRQLLPLVSLDRQYPAKTLSRIKNLLIFT
jgi:hypothetical protein